MIRFIAMLVFLLPMAAQAGLDEGVEAYANGDYTKAMAEFRALADQGDVKGQYFVGLFHHSGYGVPRDQAEAIKWFRKAAEQGDARSQYYVGLMMASGQGVAKDAVAGYMWLMLSALNPSTSQRDKHYTKEEIDKIARKMTPEQVAQAQDMAKNWKPGSEK